MRERFFNMIPGLEFEELQFLESIAKDIPEEKLTTFISIYSSKRRSSDTILVGVILGFFCIAGIQRFMTNQIGMGILFLFTAGLCYVGTIIDLINYKKLAFEYNQKAALDALQLIRMIG